MPPIKRTSTYLTPGGAKGPKKKKRKIAPFRVTSSPFTVGATLNAGPFGKSQKAHLVFSSRFSVNANQSLVYSLNSVYDPFVSGVGHQPRGLDQIFTMFDHAVVIGAKVELWGVTTGVPVLLCATVRDNNTSLVDYRDVIESGYSSNTVLGTNGSTGGKLEMNVDPNKFLGRSKPLSDPELKNSAVGGPTDQAFLHVHNINMDDGGAAVAKCLLRITYTTVFIEPKLPPIS